MKTQRPAMGRSELTRKKQSAYFKQNQSVFIAGRVMMLQGLTIKTAALETGFRRQATIPEKREILKN